MDFDLNAGGELSRKPTEEDHRLQIQQMPEQFRSEFGYDAKLGLCREADANGLGKGSQSPGWHRRDDDFRDRKVYRIERPSGVS